MVEQLPLKQLVLGSSPSRLTMTKITQVIKHTEKKWLDRLYQNCRNEFKKVNLSSHDHEHHRRVWENAKQIFLELESAGFKLTENLIEKTIFAVFFHDLGLTAVKDEIGHGLAGLGEVLSVIEKHDDKFLASSDKASLMAILNTADDLDAFGAVGVLRYAEIYLLRDNDLKTLPDRVIKNLDKRFENFINAYSDLKSFAAKQKERYLYTRKFYTDLRLELAAIFLK